MKKKYKQIQKTEVFYCQTCSAGIGVRVKSPIKKALRCPICMGQLVTPFSKKRIAS